MLEKKYRPTYQSTAYTPDYAAALGVTAEALDPADLVRGSREVRERHAAALTALIRGNLEVCGEGGRVSLPTYAAKRLLPDTATYNRVVEELDVIFGNVLAENPNQSVTKLFSVGYGPDGYKPEPNETAIDAYIPLAPQFVAAKFHNARPVAEATASEGRFLAAWCAANNAEVPALDIGLAFDSRGRLAADGKSLAHICDIVDRNHDRLDTRVTIGANCGSFTGIQKAAREVPGAIRFAYPNSRDVPDIARLHAIGSGSGCIHHHGDAVSVEEFGDFAIRERIPVISLCCGFCPEDLSKLKAYIEAE